MKSITTTIQEALVKKHIPTNWNNCNIDIKKLNTKKGITYRNINILCLNYAAMLKLKTIDDVEGHIKFLYDLIDELQTPAFNKMMIFVSGANDFYVRLSNSVKQQIFGRLKCRNNEWSYEEMHKKLLYFNNKEDKDQIIKILTSK